MFDMNSVNHKPFFWAQNFNNCTKKNCFIYLSNGMKNGFIQISFFDGRICNSNIDSFLRRFSYD